MKIYISGKITGLDIQDAAVEFTAAQLMIERLGHEALNPLSEVDQTEGREYCEYLADALRILLTEADAVYFLPNWRDASDGAAIEHFIAARLAKFRRRIFYSLKDVPQVSTAVLTNFCGGCGVMITDGMPHMNGRCQACFY